MKMARFLDRAKREFFSFQNTFVLKVSATSHDDIGIVTAFDSSHFLSGEQLLNSLKVQGIDQSVFFYDLGLSASQLESIRNNFPLLKVRKFPFDKYPSFVKMQSNAGQYAWKPIIVNLMLQERFDHLLWLDAGDSLLGDLTNINKLIDKFGFFATPTSNTILELTHKDSIVRLGVNPSDCNQLQLSAAFIGFCTKHPVASSLIRNWGLSALEEAVIAPFGSDRSNHRQDQSIFNLLIVRDHYLRKVSEKIIARRYLPKHHHILTHQDIDSILS